MKRIKQPQIVDFLFTAALLGLFAISAIFVVFFGARVYENINAGVNHNFTSRTAISYITEKLRQRDSEGTATITVINDINTIHLIKKTDEILENTYIYSDDGYLKEITLHDEGKPNLKQGIPIMELQKFDVKEIAGGVFSITVVDNEGNYDTAYMSTKCDAKMRGLTSAAPVEPGGRR